jgi:hypothetical protein
MSLTALELKVLRRLSLNAFNQNMLNGPQEPRHRSVRVNLDITCCIVLAGLCENRKSKFNLV